MTDPATQWNQGDDPPAGLDLGRLRRYLGEHRPELAADPLRAQLIAGGRSNLTYLLWAGDQELVLRRPPLSCR